MLIFIQLRPQSDWWKLRWNNLMCVSPALRGTHLLFNCTSLAARNQAVQLFCRVHSRSIMNRLTGGLNWLLNYLETLLWLRIICFLVLWHSKWLSSLFWTNYKVEYMWLITGGIFNCKIVNDVYIEECIRFYEFLISACSEIFI